MAFLKRLSDNGPQYASQEFSNFSREYNFQHAANSPHFPQSNGHVERAVLTVKKLLQGSKDPYMALLPYCSTPFPWCGLSPAELLMGRPIHSNIPQSTEMFTPQWPYLEKFKQSNDKLKQREKQDYDTRHGMRPLPLIPNDTEVWVTANSNQTPGHVTAQADIPRSYLVETPSGQIRRNRLHLTVMPNLVQSEQSDMNEQTRPLRSLIQTRLRTGTEITPPQQTLSTSQRKMWYNCY